jgi:disulfide oxidoreductase YuzD
MKPYTFFIGYQVGSQYYKQHTMNLLGSHICEYLKNDLKKLNLQVLHKPFGFRNGIHILCDACKLIQKSILCIFEISDLNPNVMLEIGKSLYKKLKSEYINDNFDIKYFKEVKKYFEKSRKLNNKIIENEYYLYNLDLLNTGNNFVNKDNNITDDLIASQKNLEALVNECKVLIHQC